MLNRIYIYTTCEKERKNNYSRTKMSWKSFGINDQKREKYSIF